MREAVAWPSVQRSEIWSKAAEKADIIWGDDEAYIHGREFVSISKKRLMSVRRLNSPGGMNDLGEGLRGGDAEMVVLLGK